MVPTCVPDPPSHRYHPGRNGFQPAGSFCPWCFWQVVGSLWSLHVSWIPPQMDPHPGRNVHLNSFFCFWQAVRHLWSLHMLGSPFTQTSTLVGMFTCLAGSFCLCCFWQVVRHLCSLHVSRIPHHTNFCHSRNVNPKSWFILSVLFWTGGETSVVDTRVRDPPLHRSLPK